MKVEFVNGVAGYRGAMVKSMFGKNPSCGYTWTNRYDNKKELGKIKSYNSIFIYVVYKCAGEWDRFKAYTGIPTDPNMLNFCKASKPTKSEILYEGRDYDSSVKEANK